MTLDNLIKELRIKADMILNCEKITFGSDAEIMYSAADAIESLIDLVAEIVDAGNLEINKIRGAK